MSVLEEPSVRCGGCHVLACISVQRDVETVGKYLAYQAIGARREVKWHCHKCHRLNTSTVVHVADVPMGQA